MHDHPWDVEPAQAIDIQKKLSKKIITTDKNGPVSTVAGIDVSYKKGRGVGAVVIFTFPGLKLLDQWVTTASVVYPYIPGFLSFREIPVILPAMEKISEPPDLILMDGQGIAHPKCFGLASHLGVIFDVPTIGCAKSRLTGSFQPPGKDKGAVSYLYAKNQVIGAVVRSRTNVSPLFVSPGHKISLQTAIAIVLTCCTRYRIPEPLRRAHHMAGLVMKSGAGA